MNLKDLARPLTVAEVEFRVDRINELQNGGAIAHFLVYKNARVDMQRLDDVVGPNNWTRQHARDNKNCIVSIWDNEKGVWVGKEDVGTESSYQKDKGLASDSFKRACFNWGIGRELYSYPKISIRLNQGEFYKKGNSVNLVFGFTDGLVWVVQHDENGDVSYVGCKNKTGLRFQYGTYKND